VSGSDSTCRLLKVPDVARRLGISVRFAWRLVAEGRIRSIRIGRCTRVRPEEVERFLADLESGA